MVDTVQLGRDAMDRHAWAEAMEAFAAADRDVGLAPGDLEMLGTAAWWAGQPDEATVALERAFTVYADAGQSTEAAGVAMALAYQAFRRQALSVGGGWLARAEHLLESVPDSPAHARVAVFHALGALIAGQITEGIALTDRAMELARTLGDPDSHFMAMSFKGMALVFTGDWQAGLPLIDEAATAASSGRLDLRVASDIYCNTIAACRSVGDLKRAGQWADEGERWMVRQSVGGYPGVCRVHRAELKMLRGLWPEAEQEARQACQELERFGLMDAVGYAQYTVGEVRLRIGDLDGAAEAFERAYEFGHDAQPGTALVQLARGETDEAARSIARALAAAAGDGGPGDRSTRGRLLPAQIDIALAAGDLETAGPAVAELESIAADVPATDVRSRGAHRSGRDAARGGAGIGGVAGPGPLVASLAGRRICPTRPRGSTPLRPGGRRRRRRRGRPPGPAGCPQHVRAAWRTTRPRRVDALLAEDGQTPDRAGERLRKTFMFTDIVTSTDLVGLIGDAAWGDLLHWHDRELRASFVSHRGEEVHSLGDGFFVAFEHATDALECAVDIQRRLARHRREHGFAPAVRIGLHSTEATRHAGDYEGRGVHVAARIGAAATGAEILVSSPTLETIGPVRFGLSDPRQLTLKGVGEPVEVRSVEWR